MVDCYSKVTGGSAPSLDLGLGIRASNVNLRRYGGGATFTNVEAGDSISAEATVGGTLTIDGTGGTVKARGQWEAVVNNGTTTVDDTAVNLTNINEEVDQGITDGDIATETQQTALVALVEDVPTVAEFEARTPTADQLAYIVDNAASGMPVTFTSAGGSTTLAVFNTVDGGAPSATNDQYNSRLLVFLDGSLKGVVTDVTDYTGGSGAANITAIPTPPLDSHNARLI